MIRSTLGSAKNGASRVLTRPKNQELKKNMPMKIETYYDFRSPYAYFADFRIRQGQVNFTEDVEWMGCPIFIDVILEVPPALVAEGCRARLII